jgi:mannose-6-phosphate isomerase-like protein (cupin superfamily)
MHSVLPRTLKDETRLAYLAMQFRATRNVVERQAIAQDYAQTVDRLIRSGRWHELPGPDEQLPDDWMPKAFFEYLSSPQENPPPVKTSTVAGAAMPDANDYPYATHLNIHYPPLEVVDVPALVAANTHPWYNQTLCRVNDSVVRLGVVQGEYHWHKHDDEDEFFYVVDGRFLIDLEDRTVELLPRQGFVVPKGVVHRTRAPERTVILMVEGAGIVPTGDAS